jgi:hypothetical protein
MPDTFDKNSLLSAEYSSLRTEMLQRISTRYTLINLTLLAFGTTIGIQKVTLVLLYPIIATFLLAMYVSNAYTTEKIAQYIKVKFEDAVKSQPGTTDGNTGAIPYVGWQNFKDSDKDRLAYGWGRWLFLFTELIAFLVAVVIQAPVIIPPGAIFLTALNGQYAVAIIFICITFYIAWRKDNVI